MVAADNLWEGVSTCTIMDPEVLPGRATWSFMEPTDSLMNLLTDLLAEMCS